MELYQHLQDEPFDQLLNQFIKHPKEISPLSTKIIGMKVDPTMSNFTILSTTVGEFLKWLLYDWKYNKVLNLLLSKATDACRVLFDTREDVRSIVGAFLHENL